MSKTSAKHRQGPFELKNSSNILQNDQKETLNPDEANAESNLDIEKQINGSNTQRVKLNHLPKHQKANILNLYRLAKRQSIQKKPILSSNVKFLPSEKKESESITEPDRDYECNNYELCLTLAAALDWSSFSCLNCNGSVDERLLWRAHNLVRKNQTLRVLCHLPDIKQSQKS